ncbi:hypothetical protein IMSAG025_01070 [Muribaculaceae bacterium]|nr:hypothetical protein IMSAG025_01070 [Muribaculaceae bacterium]
MFIIEGADMDPKIDFYKIEKEARMRKKVFGVITYVLLIFWAVIVLFPFYWMVLTSVKSYGAYNSEYIPKFFTLSPTLQNYADAFTTVPPVLPRLGASKRLPL